MRAPSSLLRRVRLLKFGGANGVEPTETQPQWEEVLHLLPKMWTQKVFEGWESKYIKLPPRRVTPQPIEKPFPPMWVASNQPYSVEFAGKNGLRCLGFGVSDAHCANYVQMYREAIRHAKPEHGIINNQFGILRVALRTPTDDEAIALQSERLAHWPSQHYAVKRYARCRSLNAEIRRRQRTAIGRKLYACCIAVGRDPSVASTPG